MKIVLEQFETEEHRDVVRIKEFEGDIDEFICLDGFGLFKGVDLAPNSDSLTSNFLEEEDKEEDYGEDELDLEGLGGDDEDEEDEEDEEDDNEE